MPLESLPTEILLICFKELDNHRDPYRFSALTNTRLTCKRFSRLVTPILFCEITPHFSSTSLRTLEKLSQNPTIAACITKVNIALHCYDPEILKDFAHFVHASMDSIGPFLPLQSDPISRKIFQGEQREWVRVYDSWEITAHENHDTDQDDQNVKLLKEGFRQYEKMYRDQEEGKPVLLLSTVFKRLKNTQEINIYDSIQQRGYMNEKGALVLAWNSGYVCSCQWRGKKAGPNIVTPWKLISDIFYCMEMSSVHPARFSLHLRGPPAVPSEFEQSPGHSIRINQALKDTTSIQIDILPHTKDNHNSNIFLGNFLKAMCGISSLEELELNLRTDFFHWDASTVLPLGTTTWACLKSLKLKSIVFDREKFQMLLEQCDKDVLERIHFEDTAIWSISREVIVDTVRRFPKLTWTAS